jgi:hypothetical protein
VGPDEQQDAILRYLYGEMSAAERDAFQQELTQDAALREALEEEESFNRMVPTGQVDEPDRLLLERGRQRLERALDDETSPARRPQTPSANSSSWRPYLLGAAAAAMLLIGVSIDFGRYSDQHTAGEIEIPDAEDIVRIDVSAGETSGDIRITAHVVTVREITGRPDNPGIQAYLASAIGADTGPGRRLDVLDRIGKVPSESPVLNALMDVLVNDPNPAVRLKAVDALATHLLNQEVRQTLLTALRTEVNPGIRVHIIDALSEATQPDLAGGIRHAAETETNPYVRTEARRIADRLDATQKL